MPDISVSAERTVVNYHYIFMIVLHRLLITARRSCSWRLRYKPSVFMQRMPKVDFLGSKARIQIHKTPVQVVFWQRRHNAEL